MAGVNAPKKPSRPQLSPGTVLGDRLRVGGWKPDHFVFAGRDGRTIGWAIGYTVVGITTAGFLSFRTDGSMEQTERWLRQLLDGHHALAVGLAWLAAIVYTMTHLGIRWSFREERRTIQRNRLLYLTTDTWDAADLRAVVLRFENVDGVTRGSFRLRASRTEMLVLKIATDDGSAGPILLTQIETDDPNGVDLVTAARAIARMFDLPVHVEGMPRRACPELQSAIGRIQQG